MRTTAAPCVDLCPTPPMPVSLESGDASDFPVPTVLGLRGKNALRAPAPLEEGTTAPAGTQAEMSSGLRSVDCSGVCAHTYEHIGESPLRASAL